MDLTSARTIKNILLKYKIKPSKTMGQNFLVSRTVLQKIIRAADLNQNDVVLEVGPGVGTLTQELSKRVKKVIAVEKDKQMCEVLKENLSSFKNIEIIQEDILKNNFQFLKGYKVVANLPYYITSPTIRKFLEAKHPPRLMVLMVQKEVAKRICSKPPDMSLLTVSVQFYADAEIISYVSKNCFWPSPKVDSSIIKIHPIKYRSPGLNSAFGRPASLDLTGQAVILPEAKLFNRVNQKKKLDKIDSNLFFKIVKAGFSHPRKQISGNLSNTLKLNKEKVNNWLLKNKIRPAQRAETLSVDDWANLTNSF